MNVDFDEIYDLDWFAVDQSGLLAHFTTGGKGAVPTQILADRPHLAAVLRIANQLPRLTEALINPNLENCVDRNKLLSIEQYLRPSVAMAERGFYSFDCDLSADAPAPYFLVAKPEEPLALDSFGEVERRLFGLIRMHLSFLTVTELDVSCVST